MASFAVFASVSAVFASEAADVAVLEDVVEIVVAFFCVAVYTAFSAVCFAVVADVNASSAAFHCVSASIAASDAASDAS